MSKKTILTPQLIEQARANIKLGFSYAALASSLNISDDTLYSWFRKAKDPETKDPIYSQFYAAIKEAEAELLTECLASVKASMKSDVKAAFFMLERRFSSDFGKSTTQTVKSENLNLNVNTGPQTWESKEQMRKEICGFFDKLNKGSSPE